MKPHALQKDSDDLDLQSWVSLGGREPADYCSREGAQSLKEKIEAYWRLRGHDVTVALHNVGFHPAIRAARFDVRSDMVNGMPRQRPEAARPANDVSFGEAEEDFAFE